MCYETKSSNLLFLCFDFIYHLVLVFGAFRFINYTNFWVCGAFISISTPWWTMKSVKNSERETKSSAVDRNVGLLDNRWLLTTRLPHALHFFSNKKEEEEKPRIKIKQIKEENTRIYPKAHNIIQSIFKSYVDEFSLSLSLSHSVEIQNKTTKNVCEKYKRRWKSNFAGWVEMRICKNRNLGRSREKREKEAWKLVCKKEREREDKEEKFEFYQSWTLEMKKSRWITRVIWSWWYDEDKRKCNESSQLSERQMNVGKNKHLNKRMRANESLN